MKKNSIIRRVSDFFFHRKVPPAIKGKPEETQNAPTIARSQESVSTCISDARSSKTKSKSSNVVLKEPSKLPTPRIESNTIELPAPTIISAKAFKSQVTLDLNSD